MFMSLDQLLEDWNAILPIMLKVSEMRYIADLAEVLYLELDATQGPPRAAKKSIYLPHNAYDYHATFIGFIAAAETSPV
jgi:hypothetical protein